MNIFIKSMIITSSVISAIGAMDPERTNPSSFKSSEEILTNAKRKIRNNNLPEAALAYLEAERVFNEFESTKQKNNALLKEMKTFRNLPSYKSDGQIQDIGYYLKEAENGRLVLPVVTVIPIKDPAVSDKKIKSLPDYGQDAFYMMGLACLNGHAGTVKNYDEAIRYFLLSAEHNHLLSQIELGILYLGDIAPAHKDFKKAEFWLKEPAQKGDVRAISALAKVYEFGGDGVEQNHNLAFNNYLKAAKKSHAPVYMSLAICYSEGKGVRKDEAKAAEWMARAQVYAKYSAALDQQKLSNQEQYFQDILNNYKKTKNKSTAQIAVPIKKNSKIDKKISRSFISGAPDLSHAIPPDLSHAIPTVMQEKPKQQPVKKPQRGMQKPIKVKTAPVIQESISSQPLENTLPVITQETPVYTRMALKKLNVEGVKAIYEKSLVKGEIYETNPNKEKMITHILKHQNEAKPEAKSEIPQIVFTDAERFANDNTSLTLFDPPKRKIRIKNPLKKLSKRAEDWKAQQTETAEEKAARKMLRNQRKVIDSNPEGKVYETSSISQSFGDLRSHFTMTDSESMSTKSLVSQSEGDIGDVALEMKLSYPQLFNLLKKANYQNASEIKFKSSNIIRATLSIMKELGYIDGTIGTANIHVTRKNSMDAFISHITHGSGAYKKWYHNPEIVVEFFDFISKSDPVIAEYLNSVFEEKYISKDITRINDAKKPTDNAPNEAGED